MVQQHLISYPGYTVTFDAYMSDRDVADLVGNVHSKADSIYPLVEDPESTTAGMFSAKERLGLNSYMCFRVWQDIAAKFSEIVSIDGSAVLAVNKA